MVEKHIAYVALLRGINVGGNHMVPMKRLAAHFEELGFTDVKTLLASGNVVFKTTKPFDSIRPLLESAFLRSFGFAIPSIVWPISDIVTLIKDQPFKKIKSAPSLRLYITFLSESTKSTLVIPYISPDGSFTILAKERKLIASVLDTAKAKTPQVMQVLEKNFGKNITTRNWNTVQKIAALG